MKTPKYKPIRQSHIKTAMKILCAYESSRVNGHSITPAYLYFQGFPKNVDADLTIEHLSALKYVTYNTNDDLGVRLTDYGKLYPLLETQRIKDRCKDNWRYAITTFIAALGLVKAFWPEILALVKCIFK